jgi:hypothetical protein
MDIVCVIDFFIVASGVDIQSRYYHFVGSLSIEKWAHNGVFIGQTFTGPGSAKAFLLV